MLVLAVVYGVHQFVHQGVDHFIGRFQCGGNEYLVQLIRRAVGGPTLTHMATACAGAGKATRNLARGQGIAFGCKQGREQVNCGQEPGFAGGVNVHGYNLSW